ncbi:Zinc transporter 8 [Capsicum chinense]|nr:Zinc transporter 8 [Capsicum chinense]
MPNFEDDTLGESESGRNPCPWLLLQFDPDAILGDPETLELSHLLELGILVATSLRQDSRLKRTVIVEIFFSLTTPIGLAIGFGISIVYSETSPTELIVEGIFNSAAAAILIYMALVDLLTAGFMSARMQDSPKLLIGAIVQNF